VLVSGRAGGLPLFDRSNGAMLLWEDGRRSQAHDPPRAKGKRGAGETGALPAGQVAAGRRQRRRSLEGLAPTVANRGGGRRRVLQFIEDQ